MNNVSNKTSPSFFSRLLHGFSKPKVRESEEATIDRFAVKLDTTSRDRLDAALRVPGSQSKAQAFADALTAVDGKAETRPLYAATLKGLEEVQKEARSPVLQLVETAVRSASSVIPGADEFYIQHLIQAASIGLESYATNPDADLLNVAAKLDNKVTMLLEEMTPVLVEHRPELEGPLEVLNSSMDEMERTGSLYHGYSAGPWLEDLAEMENPTIGKTFAAVLDNGYSDFADVREYLGSAARKVRFSDDSGPAQDAVLTFADSQLEQLGDKPLETMFNEWKTLD